MQNLGTTNILLTIIAVTVVAQFLLLLIGVLWARRQAERLLVDLHAMAERTEQAGREVERVARIAQDILTMVGIEVDRATQGVRVAMDIVEGAYTQASAIGAGLRAAVQEWLRNRKRPQDQEPGDA